MTKHKELKARNMLTLKRLGIYLVAWILLVIATGIISADGLFIPIDEYVYSRYLNDEESKEKRQILNKFVFIDIPIQYTDTILTLAQKRTQTARLLNTIDSMVTSNKGITNYENPIIVLDISYNADTTAITPLKAALARHKLNKVKVYGAYPAPDLNDNTLYNLYDSNYNSEIYDHLLVGGRLHVGTLEFENPCLRSYESFIKIDKDSKSGYYVPSLINRIAHDKIPGSDDTDFNDVKISPINTKDLKDRFGNRTYEFNDIFREVGRYRDGPLTHNREEYYTESGGYYKEFDNELDLNGSYIIIGQFDTDLHKICDDENVPGPYILGSGIIDRLISNKTFREAHDNVPVQLGMAFLFSLLVCLFFALIYKYVKSFKTKPLLISFLAFVIGIMLLVSFGYALLQYTVIRPALPTVGMFWAAFLSWRFSNKFLVTGIIEGSDKYDIFISYSFGDSKWVKDTLYDSLSKIVKPNGSKLDIFLAEKSITVGELFVSKYMKAIVDSKFFISVMSEEYYTKNHCINEMDLAVKRKIEEHINICILAFNPKHVPDQFTNLLFLDANNPDDFIPKIEKEVIAVKDDTIVENTDAVKTIEKAEKVENLLQTDIIPKGSDLDIGNKKEIVIDSNEMMKEGVQKELFDRGIIIINNSSGELTLDISGVTLKINNTKKKKKLKKKKHNKTKKKSNKSSQKKGKKRKNKK